MKKGTNEPTLSDVLERIDKGFNDLTDFFSKSGVKDAEPTEPEWEDLTVTWTLNKEQAIEMWHRLDVILDSMSISDNYLRRPKNDNLLVDQFNEVDDYIEMLGLFKF